MAKLVVILKALSDETRFNIVNLLLKHDFCVSALAGQLGISKAAVSQHLQILRKAGIVNGEKRGYYTHYCVKREILKDTAERIIDLSCQKQENKIDQERERQCCRKEGDKDV